MNEIPSLDEFLTLPLEAVRRVAPQTIIFGAGGTRRRAVLAGIDGSSEQFASWTRLEMMKAVELILEHGTKYLFVPIMVDGNHQEITVGYREHLMRWIEYGIAGDDALEDFARMDCQVRLIGSEHYPDLQSTSEQLMRASSTSSQRFVWFTVVPSSVDAWEQSLRCLAGQRSLSYREAVVAMFGQDIPTDDALLLDFGKPQIFTSTIAPLLINKLHCYWRQSLGYSLTSEQLRRIIYDYAFNRPTWMPDKRGRADKVTSYAELYQDPPILGEGVRIGPFWYPKIR